MGSLKNIIKSNFEESIKTKKKVINEILDDIEKSAILITEALRNKKKLMICGNGGSAADSQHFAAELVGRFKMERKGLPAIALTVDTSILTAWSNDYTFDTVFSRQIESIGEKGDVLFSISTSGNSKNLINGILKAKEMGIITISLLGKGGGKMKEISDYNIIIPSQDGMRVQESHITVIHSLCEIIEKSLFQ